MNQLFNALREFDSSDVVNYLVKWANDSPLYIEDYNENLSFQEIETLYCDGWDSESEKAKNYIIKTINGDDVGCAWFMIRCTGNDDRVFVYLGHTKEELLLTFFDFFKAFMALKQKLSEVTCSSINSAATSLTSESCTTSLKADSASIDTLCNNVKEPTKREIDFYSFIKPCL